MLTVSLLTGNNNAVQLDGSNLVVATKQAFTLVITNDTGVIDPASFSVSPDLASITSTVYYSDTELRVVFSGGILNPQAKTAYQFGITTEGTGDLVEFNITVVPRYHVKKHSAHLWNVYNYDQTNSVYVEITNISDNTVVKQQTMGADSMLQIQLPDDGIYQVKFGSGSTANYAYIVDNSIVDKLFTDVFRKIFCCSCDASRKKMYWWEQLTTYRDALQLQMGKLSTTTSIYSATLFEEALSQYLKVDEIRSKVYSIGKKFLSSKCLDECSC